MSDSRTPLAEVVNRTLRIPRGVAALSTHSFCEASRYAVTCARLVVQAAGHLTVRLRRSTSIE